MEEIFKKRMLEKYNLLIDELEAIHKDYMDYVEKANKDPDSEKNRRIMLFAKDNLRRLQFAKAERDLLIN